MYVSSALTIFLKVFSSIVSKRAFLEKANRPGKGFYGNLGLRLGTGSLGGGG